MACRTLLKELAKANTSQVSIRRSRSAMAYTARYEFETLEVSAPTDHVLHVEMNRPEIYNAINKEMFRELAECFNRISDDKQCRAVVISGNGKLFSAGMDYADIQEILAQITGAEPISSINGSNDVARKAKYLRDIISHGQLSFSAMESCSKPIIASVHGACIGAAMAVISACDIRYTSKDTHFQLRDVDAGMASDMGTLQRLPKIIGNDSTLRELIYTSREFGATEAQQMGLVSKVFADPETTCQAAIELAQTIASKSPVAVQGSKICLKYSRDHNIHDGLRFMANWNMVMLQSEDVLKAATAVATKSKNKPTFSDL
ncbi:Delta-3,5-Delta-2,4-dienoyl-CoA isomerase, mitochondrial [Halotydeus destructor]|nr:Delta-3,5-Delta-2,4-dienoyl-CoA isomerase, mitochondrial [Halotydeus destructor]